MIIDRFIAEANARDLAVNDTGEAVVVFADDRYVEATRNPRTGGFTGATVFDGRHTYTVGRGFRYLVMELDELARYEAELKANQ